MIFKPFYRDETGCAAYVFGCGTTGKGAVVDDGMAWASSRCTSQRRG